MSRKGWPASYLGERAWDDPRDTALWSRARNLADGFADEPRWNNGRQHRTILVLFNFEAVKELFHVLICTLTWDSHLRAMEDIQKCVHLSSHLLGIVLVSRQCLRSNVDRAE